ncbi:hypothetical protein [Actinomadura sp. SCN-SB]|uniref:hypothetical protein n=1 Tax=Actinomadura sp. SCN-SB TaxID=3373092 RepID=UPI0037512233
MAARLRKAWPVVAWWSLVGVDVVVVAVFAVTAATDPYHVLEGERVEIHNFQGLLPTAIVVVLRSMTLVAERRLLPVAHGALVLAGRLASLIGFNYIGRWLYERAYGRWYEVILGGTVGYAFAGVLGIGLAALIYNLSRYRIVEPGRKRPPGGASIGAADPLPAVPRSATDMTSEPDVSVAPVPGRRQLTRDSLFSVVGVFIGVTGLVMGVTNLVRLGLAVLVGAAVVAAIALLARGKHDSAESSRPSDANM